VNPYKSVLYKIPAVVCKDASSGESVYIDLNERLVKNRPATCFLSVLSNAMGGAQINYGDMLIVDRSIEPESGKIVIANIDGEMLIRRLEKTMNRIRLIPEGSELSSIEITNLCDMKIWGVVTHIIKRV
jgi:DNA polymerase V